MVGFCCFHYTFNPVDPYNYKKTCENIHVGKSACNLAKQKKPP